MPRFATVILVDPHGRLLLQERDEHPVIDPERWGMPGGHVDDGEGFEAAAYRELAEETGVELAPGVLQLFAVHDVWHEAYASLDPVHVYVAATRLTDADIDCREGRRIVFVDPDVALTLPLTGSASAIVPAFLASDHYADLKRKLAS